jgi:hypothetical protein
MFRFGSDGTSNDRDFGEVCACSGRITTPRKLPSPKPRRTFVRIAADTPRGYAIAFFASKLELKALIFTSPTRFTDWTSF